MAQLDEKLDDAINQADLKLVKELIEKGADVEYPDSFGCTPIMNAAWVASEEIVSYLLSVGANPNHRDKEGKTALDKVLEIGHNDYGHNSVIQLLKNLK